VGRGVRDVEHEWFGSDIRQTRDAYEEVLSVLLHLCESNDVSIRRQVLKDLETMCKDAPNTCQRVAETLSQLLVAEDATELTLVQKCLVTLFKTNAKDTLQGIFQQIIEGEELMRDRAITFLSVKMKLLIPDESMPKDIEEVLVQHCRKVLEDVSGSEFVQIMHLLTSLPSMNTLVGRQQLLDIVTEQAELTEEFQPSDVDCIERLTQCIKEAMPLFSKNVHSTKFVEYICINVLPVSDAMPEANILEVFKLLAEMSINCGDLEESTEKCVAAVFLRLVQYMPLPRAEEEAKDTPEDEPKLEFSRVECLMYTFHQLARKCPEFLTAEANAERLRDFRLRLQCFARGVQVYIKSLRQGLQGKSEAALKQEENQNKTFALKTTNNINSLIKDLFYNPPAYKAIVSLSFKVPPPVKRPEPAAPAKRSNFTPVTFGGGANDGPAVKKSAKDDRKMYAPPSGKFSEKAGQFPMVGQRGQRTGGRRGGYRSGYGGW